MPEDMTNPGNGGLEAVVAKHDSDIAALTRDVGSLTVAVRDLGNVVRTQGERTEVQIMDMSKAIERLAVPKGVDKSILLTVVGLILTGIALFMAVGTGALSPIRIGVSETRQALSELTGEFKQHIALPLHQVGQTRIDAMEKFILDRVAKRDAEIEKILQKIESGNANLYDLKERILLLEQRTKTVVESSK